MTTEGSQGDRRIPARRRLAWAGVAGPVAFTAAWVTAAALRPGYRPWDDTISRLAATGSPHRWLMTSGFVVFGVTLPLYAPALRAALPGPAWAGVAGTGVATLGVAALPVAASPTVDALHALAAAAGYGALAAAPLLAVRDLWACGHRQAAVVSGAAGTASAAALLASLGGSATGALQRAGLGTGHAWVAASAVWILARGGTPRTPRAARTPRTPARYGGRRRRGPELQ